MQTEETGGSNLSTWVIVIVALMGLCYGGMRLVLWVLDRRARRAEPPYHPRPLDIRRDLPDDPAEALAALHDEAHPRKD